MRTIEEFLFDWVPIILMKIKLFVCGKSRIVSEIRIVDWGNNRWYDKPHWSIRTTLKRSQYGNAESIYNPRWNVHITFKRSSTNELESAFMNRWFSKKSRYKNIRIVIFREQ